VKNIYLPWWQGKIPHSLGASYVKLKKTVIANNGKIIPISYRKTLFIDQMSTLFIEPDAEKNICYYDATYQSLKVNGTINDQMMTL